MTEQKAAKFTDQVKPVQKEELSMEDQEKYFGSQLSNEDLDLINGPIESPPKEEPKEKLEELGKSSDKLSDTAIKAVTDITDMFVSMSCIDIAKFAKQDTYEITFDDGRTEVYERVGASKFEEREIRKLNIEVETGLDYDTGEKFDARTQDMKQEQLEQLIIKYFLRNAETKKPMSPSDIAHVKPGALISSIAKSCLLRSVHNIVSGKK